MDQTNKRNQNEATQVAGRTCDGCTMCCKLPSIEELDKPRLKWCQHCTPSSGCNIYVGRPETCKNFRCGYLLNPTLDEAWKPSRSKLLLTYEEDAHRLVVHVDPSRPGAWQGEPFYSTIKEWAVAASQVGGQVVIWVGNKTIAVLPDRDKDLGEIRQDQLIITSQKFTPFGLLQDVHVVDSDSPMALKMMEQKAKRARSNE